MELLPFDAYDGVLRDSNYSDYASQAMLYLSLASSRDDMLKDMSPESYLSVMKKSPKESLSLLLFRYSTLREQAYQEGLIKRNGSNLSFMKPSSQRLYQQREVFSLAPKRVVWDTYDVSFVLPPNLIWSNMQGEIRDLRVRFEENAPFKVVKPSQPISHHYQREGIHRIVFQIRLKDGRSLQSQTNIQIVLPKELRSGSSTTNYIHNEVPIPSKRRVHKGGTLQICYADPTVRKLRNPLIIAEGFEVSNLGFHENYDLQDFMDYTLDADSINNPFVGFDIVYLDYNCPTDDIWRNAELMRDAIRWVNANKEGSSENIVMGYSMGGLVAAIALRQMELANEDHDTKKYISLDSPHCGATVPFAVFAAYDYFHPLVTQSRLYGLITKIKPEIQTSVLNLQALRDAPAVRQMVIAEGREKDRRVHLDFQKKYRELGLPTKTINIAFSNSSQEAKYPKIDNLLLFSFGGDAHVGGTTSVLFHFLNYVYYWTLLGPPPIGLNLLPRSTDVLLDLKLRLVSSSDPEFEFLFKIKKKILGAFPSSYHSISATQNYPYSADGVSERSVCSTLGIKSKKIVNEKYLSGELSFGNDLFLSILNWSIGAVKYGAYVTNSIGFIPRYSSLYTPLARGSKESPFDRFYCIQADTSAGHEYLSLSERIAK
ncbi:MAG: esterase/lipase family protein [Porphyromonas endodontalis]